MENEINDLTGLQSIIEGEKGLIAYFYSNHCAPCLSLRPKVKQMADENFPGLRLVFVNSEQIPAIPAYYGVFANPGIIVFFEGKEFRRYSKYISINELGGDIQRIYKMVFE